MQPHGHALKLNAALMAAVIGGLSCLLAPAISLAVPYTDHFAPLITELKARSTTFSNRPTKIERQQKVAVDRTLALLLRTVSTSEFRDLQNAITASKILLKAFPITTGPSAGSALPTESTLLTILEELFTGFNGDISNMVASSQIIVGGLVAGSCHDNAQIFLNQAVAALNAPGVTNFITFYQSLSTALKATLKAEALAASNACMGGGSGSDSLAMTVNRTPWTAATGSTGGAYTQSTKVLVLTGAQDNNNSAVAIVVNGVTGPGTYTTHISGNYADFTTALLYFVGSGQLTVSTFNLNSHKISGTFTFRSTTGTNIVTATQGTFNLKGLTVN